MKMRLQPSALIAAAAVLIGLVAAAAAGSPAGTPIVVPLYVEHGPRGEPRLGIDVAFADRTVRVLLDTGSAGLRVLASQAGASPRRTGREAAGGYGSGLSLHGEEATAALTIGSAHGDAIPIELVDSFGCLPEQPNCPAANGGTPEMFGALFPGILGVSAIDPPGGRCCANPLPTLAGGVRSYIVHSNFAHPALILNPDAATANGFTMVDAARGTSPRGCIRITGAEPSEVCGEVLFDTGTPPCVVTTTGTGHDGPFPPHTPVTISVGAWSHTFAVGPGTPLRLNVRRGAYNRIVIGLAMLQDFDVYYDIAGSRIGLSPT
jgi:hypothetical protein